MGGNHQPYRGRTVTPRTIRLEQAKLLKAVDENGKPLVAEPQPEQPQILAQPTITLTPEINIPEIKLPEIVVNQPDIYIDAPNMEPVAAAISKSISDISTPIVQVAAPDLQPVAEAINNMAEAITSKADHGEAIKDLLQQIANRPQNAKWKFVVTRDARGDIETMEAVKEMTA